jgi:large subunit ribosomal protein L17
MRHQKKGKKFHRERGQRRTFLRNLANDLIRTGKIETTEARAKAIRSFVERCLTIAKKGDLASRRLLLSRLHNNSIVHKLANDLAPRYEKRKGGYLRITKSAKARKRDGVRVAVIEFV